MAGRLARNRRPGIRAHGDRGCHGSVFLLVAVESVHECYDLLLNRRAPSFDYAQDRRSQRFELHRLRALCELL